MVKIIILFFQFMLIVVAVCNKKTVMIDVTKIESQNSIFFMKIIGKYTLWEHAADESDTILIEKNGIYSTVHETWGCIYKKTVGKWGLEDSLLYLVQDSSISFNCNKYPSEVSNTTKDSNQYIVYKVITVNDSCIKYTLPKNTALKENYLMLLRTGTQCVKKE